MSPALATSEGRKPSAMTAPSATTVPASGPAKGDQNPYGVAVVPRSVGKLVKCHVLVSNFDGASNHQGTGSSIVDISHSGGAHVFAVVPRPDSEPVERPVGRSRQHVRGRRKLEPNWPRCRFAECVDAWFEEQKLEKNLGTCEIASMGFLAELRFPDGSAYTWKFKDSSGDALPLDEAQLMTAEVLTELSEQIGRGRGD